MPFNSNNGSGGPWGGGGRGDRGKSPWSGGARGFSRGSIFNRTGELVASVAQEGLIRRRESRA